MALHSKIQVHTIKIQQRRRLTVPVSARLDRLGSYRRAHQALRQYRNMYFDNSDDAPSTGQLCTDPSESPPIAQHGLTTFQILDHLKDD